MVRWCWQTKIADTYINSAAGTQTGAGQANPNAAVICRRVGSQPLATFAIVYDATFFNNSLVPLRDGELGFSIFPACILTNTSVPAAFLPAPAVFPNVIPTPAHPVNPFEIPKATSHAPVYTPPSPPREADFMPGRPKGQAMSVEFLTRSEDPKLLVLRLYNHIQRLQDQLDQAAGSDERRSPMEVDMERPSGNFKAGHIRSPAAMESQNGPAVGTSVNSVKHNNNNNNNNTHNIQIHNPVFNLSPPPMPPSPAAMPSYVPRSPSPYRPSPSSNTREVVFDRSSPHSSSPSNSGKRRRSPEDGSSCERRKKDKNHHKKRRDEHIYGERSSFSMSSSVYIDTDARQRRDTSPSTYNWA